MKIYHYTDLNGLKGIIESGSLWATHYQVFKNRVIYTKEDSTVEARNEILAFFLSQRFRRQ